jgi:hypothetical protein
MPVTKALNPKAAVGKAKMAAAKAKAAMPAMPKAEKIDPALKTSKHFGGGQKPQNPIQRRKAKDDGLAKMAAGMSKRFIGG